MTENIYINNLMLDYFRTSSSFDPNDVVKLSWDDQRRLVEVTLEHPLSKRYGINTKFSLLFFKKLLAVLEGQQIDVHDDIYTCICSLMKNADNLDEKYCFHHYILDSDLNKAITIKETNNLVVNGTTGMRTWEAAILLADWAISNKELFHKKTILELGSGVGFTGITIAHQCELNALYLSDCHEDVLQTISSNIEINFPTHHKQCSNEMKTYNNGAITIGVLELDWNTFSSLPESVTPDIVIGADIVYDPSIMQPLCNVIEKLFQNPDLKMYIASVIRNEETNKLFRQTLGQMGFTCHVIEYNVSNHIHWNTKTPISLLQICK